MEEIEKTYDKILDKIPKELDFGFIAVKNENTKLIILENHNKSPIPFNIESNDDFKFEPNTGNIPKLGKIEIKVKIYPQSAIVSVGNAQIILGKDTSRKARIIKLCAISKYPYLKIHKNILDFGNVVIGKTKELELIINNPEKVEAKFNIEKKKFIHAKSIEQFYVSDLSGIVPPESSFLLKIKYVTSYPNFFSYETFDILTKGGNINRFSCIAHSQGLTTNISDKFINFHSVELNTTKTKMIRLFNESDELTYFQFFYNNDHVFFFDELEGVIPAKSNVRVTITFKPNETVSYYDRIFCLIKNHFLFVRFFKKIFI